MCRLIGAFIVRFWHKIYFLLTKNWWWNMDTQRGSNTIPKTAPRTRLRLNICQQKYATNIRICITWADWLLNSFFDFYECTDLHSNLISEQVSPVLVLFCLSAHKISVLIAWYALKVSYMHAQLFSGVLDEPSADPSEIDYASVQSRYSIGPQAKRHWHFFSEFHITSIVQCIIVYWMHDSYCLCHHD